MRLPLPQRLFAAVIEIGAFSALSGYQGTRGRLIVSHLRIATSATFAPDRPAGPLPGMSLAPGTAHSRAGLCVGQDAIAGIQRLTARFAKAKARRAADGGDAVSSFQLANEKSGRGPFAAAWARGCRVITVLSGAFKLRPFSHGSELHWL